MVRRMNFRNERTLYNRKCDLCKKEIISMYDKNHIAPVYCYDCWHSDKWNPMDYGNEYDLKITFFEQIKNLVQKVPCLALEGYKNTNATYSNFTWLSKNVYLSPSTLSSENVAYSKAIYYARDIFESYRFNYSELAYEGINGQKNSRVKFLQNSYECLDSYFLYDCVNCQNCFMSSNLRHQKYVFRNKKLAKEEYEQKMREIDFGSYEQIVDLIKEYESAKLSSVRKFIDSKNVTNVTGDSITNSKNSIQCFNIEKCEDVKYFFQGLEIKDGMDLTGAGGPAEILYEGVNVGYQDTNILFCLNSYIGCIELKYDNQCSNSQYIFGCVGLRNKQYCILNKQYAKEEYETLVPKIIKHMNDMPYIDQKGRIYKYGEFFPPELSPFAYNETIAQEYFPLTKDEAIKKGYSWKDPEPRNYTITLKTEDIPDHIKDVKDSILNDIIQCAHHELGHSVSKCNEQCTEAYRIIPQELDFLRKMNLPLPRLCPNCRHYQRIKQRNPLKLWKRKCQCAGAKSENQVYTNTIAHEHGNNRCDNNFETTYAPERPEIVYCEKCYLKEVV